MDIVTRLVQLSEMFRSAKSIEELTEMRDRVRAEVKMYPRDNQRWILDEWESAEWLLNNHGESLPTKGE